jgi:hypothetical protein
LVRPTAYLRGCSALAFFALVVLFILKQRIVDRGLRIAFWWTRLLPSRNRGDSILAAQEVTVEKGYITPQCVAEVASASSTTAAIMSQVDHAAESGWNDLSTSSLELDTLPTFMDMQPLHVRGTLRVIINDNRAFVGTFVGTGKSLNTVSFF